MKRAGIIAAAMVIAVVMSGCSLEKWTARFKNPLEEELKSAARVVFTNTKEPVLRFTVADPKVVKQVAAVLGKGSAVESIPGVESDYEIKFYMQNGTLRTFQYWMGASESGKDVNFKDDSGAYYRIPESLDLYIVNSTKMMLRPKNFVGLYSACLSDAVSLLERAGAGRTEVGVDIKSDRRMRRYTMSYEDERIFQGISAEGYKIVPWSKDEKYTYVVSYVTNIYSPNSTKITVEALKVEDQTIETYVYTPKLSEDGTMWALNRQEEDKEEE